MSSNYDISPAIPSQELLDRNAAYAENHKPKLGQHNWGNFPKNAISMSFNLCNLCWIWKIGHLLNLVTCMDCRLQYVPIQIEAADPSTDNMHCSPHKQLGLADHDTTIIRNASGAV